MCNKLSAKGKRVVCEAVADCISRPKYSVGIFLNSDETRVFISDIVEDLLLNTYSYTDMGYRINCQDVTDIKLWNGSTIQLYNIGSSSVRNTRKCSCAIYEKDLVVR